MSKTSRPRRQMIWVPTDLATGMGLTPTQILVYLALQDRRYNKTLQVVFQPKRIAARCGIKDPDTVRSAVKRLLEVGLIATLEPGPPGCPSTITMARVHARRHLEIPVDFIWLSAWNEPTALRFGGDTNAALRSLLALLNVLDHQVKSRPESTELPIESIADGAAMTTRNFQYGWAHLRAAGTDEGWITVAQTYAWDGRQDTLRITLDWANLTAGTPGVSTSPLGLASAHPSDSASPQPSDCASPQPSGSASGHIRKPGSSSPDSSRQAPPSTPVVDDDSDQASDQGGGVAEAEPTWVLVASKPEVESHLRRVVTGARGRTGVDSTAWASLVLANLHHADRNALRLKPLEALKALRRLEQLRERGWDALAVADAVLSDSNEGVYRPAALLLYRLDLLLAGSPRRTNYDDFAVWCDDPVTAGDGGVDLVATRARVAHDPEYYRNATL